MAGGRVGAAALGRSQTAYQRKIFFFSNLPFASVDKECIISVSPRGKRMKVICKNDDTTQEQFEKDLSEIERQNRIALKESLTWKVFGGIISVAGRTYQVVN